MKIIEDEDFKGLYRIIGSRRYVNRLLTYEDANKIVSRYEKRRKSIEDAFNEAIEKSKDIEFSYEDLYTNSNVVTASYIEEAGSDAFGEEVNDNMSLGEAFIALYGSDDKWDNTSYSRSLYDISKNSELLDRLYKVGKLDAETRVLIKTIRYKLYPFKKLEDNKNN